MNADFGAPLVCQQSSYPAAGQDSLLAEIATERWSEAIQYLSRAQWPIGVDDEVNFLNCCDGYDWYSLYT